MLKRRYPSLENLATATEGLTNELANRDSLIRRAHHNAIPLASIARATNLSRPTIHQIVSEGEGKENERGQAVSLQALRYQARDLERARLTRDEMIRDAITAGIPMTKVADAVGLTRQTVATIRDTDPLTKRIELTHHSFGRELVWTGTLRELITLDGDRLSQDAEACALPIDHDDYADFARWALSDWADADDATNATWQ